MAQSKFDVSKFPTPPSGGAWGLPSDPLANVSIDTYWEDRKVWLRENVYKKHANKKTKEVA